ncbi:hypothetical protein BDZ90DRAFT_262109 [Jaminaea rosea]|uniref:Secreted protein n=1 Tax=Jaminaea rosea TaxID=1569628 RepID=A0A316UKX8_9BASI|nr:hypothetical protein BDZ90DRAFT_262109 [Jaminaea rosea]PWN25458.1 hypothetical protein BDZ90DRAFT_262109 [Jaminaea rosea]
MLSLLPVTTAIVVVLAHLSTIIFAANGPTGYCFTVDDLCGGVKYTTIYGNNYPGVNKVGPCQSVVPSHKVSQGCSAEDCSSGCTNLNVPSRNCVEHAGKYKCLRFANDGLPPLRLRDAVKGELE